MRSQSMCSAAQVWASCSKSGADLSQQIQCSTAVHINHHFLASDQEWRISGPQNAVAHVVQQRAGHGQAEPATDFDEEDC